MSKDTNTHLAHYFKMRQRDKYSPLMAYISTLVRFTSRGVYRERLNKLTRRTRLRAQKQQEKYR